MMWGNPARSILKYIQRFQVLSKHGGARENAGRKPGKVSAAKREIMDMAKDHAELALQVLVDIATSGEAESARVSAANAILDRAYGKPVQGVTLAGTGDKGEINIVIRDMSVDT